MFLDFFIAKCKCCWWWYTTEISFQCSSCIFINMPLSFKAPEASIWKSSAECQQNEYVRIILSVWKQITRKYIPPLKSQISGLKALLSVAHKNMTTLLPNAANRALFSLHGCLRRLQVSFLQVLPCVYLFVRFSNIQIVSVRWCTKRGFCNSIYVYCNENRFRLRRILRQ